METNKINMFNKILQFISIALIIIVPIYINHLKFGNSDITMSHYEIIEYRLSEYQKRKKSKELAHYIYSRILYWQKIKGI